MKKCTVAHTSVMSISTDILILDVLNTVWARRLNFKIFCSRACDLVGKIILLGCIFIFSLSLFMEETYGISAVGAVLSSRDRFSVTAIFSSSSSRQWYMLLAKLGVGINSHKSGALFHPHIG